MSEKQRKINPKSVLNFANAFIVLALAALGIYLFVVDMPRRGAEGIGQRTHRLPDVPDLEEPGYSPDDLCSTKDIVQKKQEKAIVWVEGNDSENSRNFTIDDAEDNLPGARFVLPPCVKLYGIIYDSHDPENSAAFLSVDNESRQRVCTIGGAFVSRGYTWTILDINDKSIVCGSADETVSIVIEDAASKGKSITALKDGKKPNIFFVITREKFEKYKKDMPSFFQGMDIVYALDKKVGRVRGLKIGNIATGHIAYEYGLRKDDIMLAINGDYLDGPPETIWAKWKKLFIKYKNYNLFYLKIERDGLVFDVVVEVK